MGEPAAMEFEPLFSKVRTYAELSQASQSRWEKLLRPGFYRKGETFVSLGETPNRVGFVLEGLFAQEYVAESGDATIKYFFPEGRFAASVGAMLAGTASKFSIGALEDTKVISYGFSEFKQLTEQCEDIARFYIRYMERHWILEKEPLEISFRHDRAAQRYRDFLKTYPGLAARLKKHHIASYLGITPTQFSRLVVSGR